MKQQREHSTTFQNVAEHSAGTINITSLTIVLLTQTTATPLRIVILIMLATYFFVRPLIIIEESWSLFNGSFI